MTTLADYVAADCFPVSDGETWMRLRARHVRSSYGNGFTADWTDPDELPVEDCGAGGLASSTNITVDAAELNALRSLRAPRGADIRAGDRMRDPAGRVWTVEGIPDEPHHPLTGWRPGMIVTIRFFA